jgi:Alpha amylase, catalytic domain
MRLDPPELPLFITLVRARNVDTQAKPLAAIAAERLWYKDAIIYQLHVKSFFDSNDDGVGDFPGLTSKLDYIAELGVNTIWLLPFYPSPLRDDGYDVSDYRNVHPDYGTLADFRHFVRQAHARGIRVITDFVVNHTSDQHPWFQRARRRCAISMCGPITIKNTLGRASSLSTRNAPIGRGIRLLRPITGIVSIRTNRI